MTNSAFTLQQDPDIGLSGFLSRLMESAALIHKKTFSDPDKTNPSLEKNPGSDLQDPDLNPRYKEKKKNQTQK